MDGQTGGQTVKTHKIKRQTEGRVDGQTGRWTHRHVNLHITGQLHKIYRNSIYIYLDSMYIYIHSRTSKYIDTKMQMDGQTDLSHKLGTSVERD